MENPAYIFRLNYKRQLLIGREGWQQKSVENLLAAIEARREPDAARFLFGLGIRHVGSVTERDLLKTFGTVERLAEVATAAPDDETARAAIVAIDGTGPPFVAALVDFFPGPHNRATLA